MARLDSLRPNLDALMKEDVKAAKAAKVPLEKQAEAPTGGEVTRDFAERIAGQHTLHATPPKPRESSLAAKTEEPAVLRNKPQAAREARLVDPLTRKPR